MILAGKLEFVELGDISAKIDWGYAKDYMKAAWEMLQLEDPNDFVIASGQAYSVQDFLEMAFDNVGLDYKKHLKINEDFIRPSKTTTLIGDISKAERFFKFKSEHNLNSLIRLMLEKDLIDEGLNPNDYLKNH